MVFCFDVQLFQSHPNNKLSTFIIKKIKTFLPYSHFWRQICKHTHARTLPKNIPIYIKGIEVPEIYFTPGFCFAFTANRFLTS